MSRSEIARRLVLGKQAMAGAPAPPYVPWETLRDAYLGRFGPLLSVEEEVDYGEWGRQEPVAAAPTEDDWEEDEDGPEADDAPPTPEQLASRLRAYEDCLRACEDGVLLHYELTFARLTEEDTRVVTASFGAVPRAGHEVFLVSAVPFCGFNGVVSRVAREHAPLSPGMVVEVEIPYTPFTAVLLAPEGAGSIPLGEAGGVPRFALRAVPLTPAEARLAAGSMDRLVEALLSVGALEVADPLRDCVVAPRRTQGYWGLMRAPLLELARHRLKRRLARHDRLVELEAPELVVGNERHLIASARLLIRHIESKPVDPASPAERRGAMFRRHLGARARIFRSAQGMFDGGAVPASLRYACAVVVVCLLQAHPVPQTLDEPAEGGSPRERFDVDEVVPRLVALIGPIVPDADPAALLAGGRLGHLVALEKCAVADGFVAPHVLWEHVMAGICLELVNDTPEREQDSLLAAFQAGVTIANLELVREDARPLLDRLEATSRMIVCGMVKAWLEAEGFPADALPEEASGRTSQVSWQEAGPRSAAKKPRVYH